MKSFSTVGWTLAKKGAIGLKIGAVIAATSAIAVTSYLISNKTATEKVDKTSKVQTRLSSFNFDNLLFPLLVTDVLPEEDVVTIRDERDLIASLKAAELEAIDPPELLGESFEVLPLIEIPQPAHKSLTSKYDFNEEDFDYFDKYGLERQITNASYVGGNEKMQLHINENLEYPEEARKNQEEGTVIVQFDLNRLGEIENARVIQSVSEQLDREALKVTESFDNWKVKEVNCIPVKSTLNVPITFELN